MKEKNPCQRVLDLVSSAPERASTLPGELAEHVKKCASCQVEVRASGRLTQLLEGVESGYKPSADPEELVRRAVSGEPARGTERSRISWIWAPAAALAGAAIVLCGVWLFSGKSRKAPAGKEKAVAAKFVPSTCTLVSAKGTPETGKCGERREFRTGRGERMLVEFEEGSSIWVNHQSSVRLGEGPGRTVTVQQGEVLVEVERHKGLKPFVVNVPTGTVEVVGTKLQVVARKRVTVVDVLRGKVVARSGGKSAEVGAGGEVILEKDKEPLVQAAADLGNSAEWATIEQPDPHGPSGFGTLKARRPGRSKDTEQALRLTDHKVAVRIQGRVARTEVEEVFHNDTAHTMEGIYTFPLPPNAKIAALDLMVDGKWEHGNIVERGRGDKIWRGVIRRATPKSKRKDNIEYIWVPGPWRDPALLKWKQGSQFELRIFPIPKKGSRTVRIAYTEVLKPIPGGRRYVLPLAADPSGRPRTERFRFTAAIGGLKRKSELRVSPYEVSERIEAGRVVLAVERSAFAPTGDVLIDIPDSHPGREMVAFAYKLPEGKEGAAGGDKDFAMFSLRPAVPIRTGKKPLRVLFVVDRSYSIQKARLKRAAELVGLLTRELGPLSQVHAIGCAAQCRELGEGFRPATSRTAADLRARISNLEPLGSTRLDNVFGTASRIMTSGDPSGTEPRVIYLGDGVPSVGETDPARLAKAAAKALGQVRLTTVGLGGEVDVVVMRALARAGSGGYVAYDPGASLRAVALRTLQRQFGVPLQGARINLPAGITEVAPEKLGQWWPGQERLIAMRLKGPADGEVVLEGMLQGRPWKRRYRVKLEPRTLAGNAFLPRLWAERRIDDLQQHGGDANRKEIVTLSKKHHVLSRFTSLLVLESKAMARAFGVKETRPDVDWTGQEGATASDTRDLDAEEEAKSKGGGGPRRPRARMAAKSARAMEESPAPSSADRSLLSGSMSPRFRPWRRRGGRFVAMRKVWYRVADIRAFGGTRASDEAELRRRIRRHEENPRSRDRTQDLVRWYVRVGDLGAAEKLAQKWLDKDRMDGGVLVELAGIAALRGDADRSVKLLASALDTDPRSIGAHTRMVDLYRAAGDRDMMCAHALTRALVDRADYAHQVTAIRCGADSERHLAGLKDALRRQAEKELAKPEKELSVRGRMTVTADWDADQDLDVVVISPNGRVISWQGGARRTRSRNARSNRTETLAISMRERGRYQVFVVPSSGSTGSANGSVQIRTYGKRRTFSFAAAGRPARVADVLIKSKFRYERVGGGGVPVPTPWPAPSRFNLSNPDILRGMNAVRSRVTACYQRYRVSGVARVSTIVRGSTGRVSSASVRGIFSGTPTGSCVARAVRRARFPRFRQSSQTFTYPFMLR